MNAADVAIIRKYHGKFYPQMKIVNVNGLATYIGIAPRGAASSEAAWLIERLTYDGDSNVTASQTSLENQIFDNYATLTYA